MHPEFHLRRQCGGCRHFHEIPPLGGGTCRKAPPKHDPYVLEAAVGKLDHPDAWFALKQWPFVKPGSSCGKFEYRCMIPTCREPITSYLEANIREGQLYCTRHADLKRKTAA